MNKIEKLTLYISSFIPLYVLILIKIVIEISQHNLSFNVTNIIIITSCVLLFVIGCLGVFRVIHKKNNSYKVEILSYRNVTEDSYLSFFPLFVLFAVSFEIEYISMFVVYFVVLVLVGIVYIKNNLFYINPLLNIMGFGCYQVEIKLESGITKTEKVFARCELKQNKYYTFSENLFIYK